MLAKSKRTSANKTASFVSSPLIPRSEIRRKIIEGVAYIGATDIATIEEGIKAGGGDLDIESPTGVSVVSRLEDEFGYQLLRLEALGRKPNMSIEFLTDHVEQSLRQPKPLKASKRNK